MTLPTLKVEIGFASDPLTVDIDATTWTDVTDYVHRVQINRGRQRDTLKIEAGTCTVTFHDPDGRFRPGNTAGAYSPNVVPMKRLRVVATYDATDYTIYSGFIDRWPQAWPQAEFSEVTVQVTDGFKVLNRAALPGSVYEVEVEADDPVHWWKLGESFGLSALDSGSDPKHGTYVGSPGRGASSIDDHDPEGSSVDFDGVNDRVDLPVGLSMPSNWTLEFMFDVDEAPDVDELAIFNITDELFASLIPSGGTDWVMAVTEIVTPGALDSISNATNVGAIVENVGYSAVAIFNGSAVDIYLDGVDSANVPISTAFGYTQGGRHIGGIDADEDHPFRGRIQHVAIYDSVLSAARITAHADARTAPWDGDRSDVRIGRILDLAGWPTDDRDLDVGDTTFGPATIGGRKALDYLQTAEESELGMLFIARDGVVRFIHRQAWVLDTGYADSNVTLTDNPGAGEYFYEDLEIDHDDVIANIIEASRQGGGRVITVKDQDSIDAYGPQTLPHLGLFLSTWNEVRDNANYLLLRNKDPQIEAVRVALAPRHQPDLWPDALGLDLGHRVTVERTDPPGGGDSFVQESTIQGVTHTIEPGNGEWSVEWDLSPADVGIDSEFLILNDATQGKLDENAVGY